MQPILDSMDVSAGQNNYNTATHKGLKSDYSMPTTIFAPPEPSRNGPTSEPTPFLTRELVGQPANFTSSDPNVLMTERTQDDNTIKPIKANMDETEDAKTPAELSISRDTPSQPRDPSPRIHEGESLTASYGSGGVVHKKLPEPKDESNPVVEEIAGEDWWGDHGTVESKRKKDTEPSTVEPVELVPAELVFNTHKKDKEGKTTIEEPLKVEEKTEDAQLEVPASTDEFGWGSLALKKSKKDKKKKTKFNFIDEDSEPTAIETKLVELVPAEWELDTYKRHEEGRTTNEEPLKVDEKTEEVKLEAPISTDEFGWGSLAIKKSKKDKKKKAKVDFVDELLEVDEKTEEPEPFEEQEFDEFTPPSRKIAKKKQKRSSIAATTAYDNELDEAEALKSLGNNAMANREYAQAEVLYTQALAITPYNPVYLCNRASAYQNIGRYAAACQDAEAAVKAYPRYEKAWNRLGLAKLSLGAARDSIDAYTKALRCGTACSESSKKGLKAAEKKLDEILGDVEYPEDNLRIPRYTLEDRADQAMANKDFERAVDLYSKVLQYDPRDFVCMSNRATALLILGSYDARTDATYLTATHPRWGRSWMTLGRVELASGNVSASVDAYNKAIKFGNVETSDCARRELTFAKQFILNHGEESTEFRDYLSSLATPEISSGIAPMTDLIRLRKEHGFELEKIGYFSPLRKVFSSSQLTKWSTSHWTNSY
jgi:tetratricopeptide (TPR) repeat protein